MELRSKLARLAARTPAVVAPSSAGAHADDASGNDVDAGPHRANELAQIRDRITELLARAPTSRTRAPIPSPPRRATADDLPFVATPCSSASAAHGSVHVRIIRHGPHARVGRIELGGARDVSSRFLSLLAIDRAIDGVDPTRALFIDTETTGLAGGTGTIPFLVGLACHDGEHVVVEQLLLRDLGEEAPLLARVAERIAASSMLVSFNGKSFDWPLLRTRFVMNRLPTPTPPPHLDLVHVARRIHRVPRRGSPSLGAPTIDARHDHEGNLLRTTSCKLTALEAKVLGFVRHDDVPSAEIPARYQHFLRTGDGDAIRAVCDHNLLDVISMVALVAVYGRALAQLDEGRTDGDLAAADLVGLATTLRRAGDPSRARRVADVAVESARGGAVEPIARRARATIAKRARDVTTAIEDFSAIDDDDARLELARLYEHRLRDPETALSLALRGTSEATDPASKRIARLRRKIERAQRRLPGI